MYEIPIYEIHLVRESSVKGDRRTINKPLDAYSIACEHYKNTDREMFSVLMLDTKNNVIGLNTVSIGSLNTSIVHPREVFKPCILSNTATIILFHNHPSGDPEPSQEDLEVTKRLKDAGEIMGIAIRDHIIIGDGVWFSFRDKELL